MSDVSMNRRSFLTTGAAITGSAALTAASYARVPGANERVGVGFIGYGLIGKRHVIDFQEQPDVDMAAISDVHRGRLTEARDFIGGAVKGYGDFRELLDDGDVDAVVVSTPDHWHTLMTMLACAAGKDVYVEKPLTLFVKEGRWMIDVARRNGSVVQVGTQQRSGEHYQRARDLIQQGHIGEVMSVQIAASRNIMPGFGSPPDGDAPPELDYDMWLGPAPKHPYNPNRSIYHFRWFWDYSGGQMTNLGQHQLDIVDWVLGVDSLAAVSSAGGRLIVKDNCEVPDTQDVLFELDGWTAHWSHREASDGQNAPYGLTFYGTKGSLGISRKGFTLEADAGVPPENIIPQFTGAHPVGGPQRIGPPPKEGEKESDRWPRRTEAIEDESGDGRRQFKNHARNFLDCVKSRETPISNLDSGHRVATMCHLANLSLRLDRKLRWESESETIIDDPEANEWLMRAYRSPWDRELRALGVS